MSSVFETVRGNRNPAVTATLKDSAGTVVNLTTANNVKFLMRLAGNVTPKVNAAATIVAAASGTVSYAWGANDTDTVGVYEAEWLVTWGDGTTQTFPAGQPLTVKIRNSLA